jgi:hypothetical protein
MTPTPETDALHSLQYIPFVNIPEEVHAAALALQFYFEQQGQQEWQFSAVADRRLVSKLERERDALKAEIESIHADIKAALIMIEKMKTTIRK